MASTKAGSGGSTGVTTTGQGGSSGPGSSGGSGGAGGAGGQTCSDTTAHPAAGINAANAFWGSDNGSSCQTAMWTCIDDATPDENHTYVYATAAGGYHTVAYPTAPSVAVTSVTVHARAEQPSGSGTATISLYDGTSLVATGTPHALTASYVDYSDTFTVPTVNAAALQTRVTFSAANGRYTQVYLVVPVCAQSTVDPIVAGAGDISCNPADQMTMPCKAPATAATLASVNPQYVFALGDNQYENAELAYYQTFYGMTWGAPGLLEKTMPVVGNHEYNGNNFSACGTNSPNFCTHTEYMRANYYTYFANELAAVDPNKNGWYSYDVPTSGEPWHVVVLNGAICDTDVYSDPWAAGSNCAATSTQVDWLVNSDLPQFKAQHPNAKCILAMWHEPRFTSGMHGPNATYQPFWQALYDAHAEIILNGHDHNYEHFSPQTPTGGSDPTHGIVQFTVGTGGRDATGCASSQPNSLMCVNNTYGILALTLHSGSADYIFMNSYGTVVNDAGTIACHD